MWMHLPSQLFPSAQESEGWSLELSSFSQTLARSATSRGMHRQPKHWRAAWTTGRLTPLRFGPTLPDSTVNDGLERWISSWAGYRANRSAWPASGRANRTSDGSGPTSGVGFGTFDRRWSFSKTSQGCCTTVPLEQRAYAAGLLDGEGCIGIGGKDYYIDIRVEMGMSTKGLPVIRWMEQTFGGSVRVMKRGTEAWRDACSWRIFGADAVNFLRTVHPFLKLKQPQAELAICCLEHLRSLGRTWTEEKKAVAASYKAEMHRLNQKGPAQSVPPPPGAIAQYVDGRWKPIQETLWPDQDCSESSVILPKRGSLRNGVVLRHRASERPTVESGCSSSAFAWQTPRAIYGAHPGMQDTSHLTGQAIHWPTPTVNDSKNDNPPSQAERNTPPHSVAAAMWQTPTVGGGGQQCELIPHKGHYLRPSGKKATLYLEQQANQWATPIAAMPEKGGTYRRGNLTIKGQVEAFSRPDRVTGTDGNDTSTPAVRLRLNPRFVEALMGLPDGMTACTPLEMQSFRSWLDTHSQRLQMLLDSTSRVRRVA